MGSVAEDTKNAAAEQVCLLDTLINIQHLNVKKSLKKGSFGANAHDRPELLPCPLNSLNHPYPKETSTETSTEDFNPQSPAIPRTNPANNDLSGQKHQNTMANQQNNDNILMDCVVNDLWNRGGNNDETFDDQNTSGVSTQPWSTAKPLPPTNTATELSKTLDELKTLDDFFPEKIMLANEEQDGSKGEQEDPDDSSQDMLDPVFENQAYVLKGEADDNSLHTIKINQLVKLTVSPSSLVEQNVLIGIYHSHPEFVSNTISGVSKEVVKDRPPPNDTPFIIGCNDDVSYKDVIIENMKMQMKSAVFTLTNVKNIYIKFLLNSTDENNLGERKSGKNSKEWHLLVIPISKHRANIIRNSSKATELTLDECIPHSILRIQVKTEVRKNQKLKKNHRSVEVEWPIFKSKKRQRLEKLYFQKKKKKIAKLTNEELQKKIGQIC